MVAPSAQVGRSSLPIILVKYPEGEPRSGVGELAPLIKDSLRRSRSAYLVQPVHRKGVTNYR
jgi:hypothetical protein